MSDKIVMNGLTFKELDEAMSEYYEDLVGRTITHARIMTQDERDSWGWDGGHWPMVFELDDGTYLIPSQDEEGNGPGDIFHNEKVLQEYE
jgi:hypothetical protein